MPNNISNVGFQNPYASDQEGIERQKALAQALQQQSMQQDPTQVINGWAVRQPMNYGKIAQALAGAYAQHNAEEKKNDLSRKVQIDAMNWPGERPQATPGSIQDTARDGTGSFDMSGAAGPQNVASAPVNEQQQMAWLMRGQQNPMTAQMSQMMLAKMMKGEEDYTLNEGAMRVKGGPNAQIIRENPKDFRPQQQNPSDLDRLLKEKSALPSGDPRSEIYDNAIRKMSETSKQITNVNQPSPITPVTIADPNDPNKTIIVDGRTRQKIGDGPKLTQTGTLENKRQFNMSGIGSTIQEAEDLLSGKATGTKPTGSGVGAAVDYAGSLIGRSPSGSVEAAKLKSVGGALVSKMPRMEGPQSDKDVMLYKEMAGKIGDSTVPVEQRIAALETVKGLWGKYERLNPDAFAGGKAATGGNKALDALLEKYK